jgi:hypothetical protein
MKTGAIATSVAIASSGPRGRALGPNATGLNEDVDETR